MFQLLNSKSIYVFLACLPLIFILVPNDRTVPDGVDEEVRPYVELFEQEGKKFKRDSSYELPDVSIAIGEINDFNIGLVAPTAIGVCFYFSNNKGMLISRNFWNNSTDTEKEMVVFHELGHCILDRMHNTATNPWGEQISLMYPSLFNQNLYRRNRAYYLDELFNPY